MEPPRFFCDRDARANPAAVSAGTKKRAHRRMAGAHAMSRQRFASDRNKRSKQTGEKTEYQVDDEAKQTL
ncbi:MAG: hypothetical protein AMXMBFR84_07220 [Candidatus Hydrogenedentota bacterium]